MRIAFVQDNGLNESLNLTDTAALLKTHNHSYELSWSGTKGICWGKSGGSVPMSS